MPRWDYECTKCKQIFEECPLFEDQENVKCPDCGKIAERQITVPNVATIECGIYPMTTDHIDGQVHHFKNKKEHGDFIKGYNDEQSAKGLENRRVKCLALEG